MRELSKAEQADRIIQAGRAVDQSWQNHCHNMRICQCWKEGESAYAEPGYSYAEAVVLGDFNRYGGKWDPEKRQRVGERDTARRVGDLLERAGVEIEWDDEWCECGSCGKLFRHSPDGYGWTLYGWISDCECFCGDCVKEDPEEYLEWLAEDSGRANTIVSDLTEHGWAKLELEFERGLHEWQASDPAKIRQGLESLGFSRVIFEIDAVGQFDCRFSVYLDGDDMDEFMERCPEDGDPVEIVSRTLELLGTDSDESPASAMRRALKGIKSPPGQGGVEYHRINPDGTVDSRRVSPEEFIDGIRD